MCRRIACVFFLLLWALASTESAEDLEMNMNDLGSVCNYLLPKPNAGFKLTIHNLTEILCYWTIQPANATDQTKINVFFQYLFLDENDIVTLYKNMNDAENGSNPISDPVRVSNGSMTIITEEKLLVIRLKGNNTSYLRRFEGLYQSQSCAFPIPPELKVIHSPVSSKVMNSSSAECVYTYSHDPHSRNMPAFLFEQFNFSTSHVEITGSTQNGPYKNDPAFEFFPDGHSVTLSIKVDLVLPIHESFRLKIHFVDGQCSGVREIQTDHIPLLSPPDVLNNGTYVAECHLIFAHSGSQALGLVFDKLQFASALDILAVNNGPSEISPSLLQVTASTANSTKKQYIRTSGPYMWIAFKPVSYASSISGNVTTHPQGGIFKGSGKISFNSKVSGSAVFLLEVEEGQAVILSFTDSSFTPPATLSVYDGFDTENLLTTLNGNVWYPVMSKSSRMLIKADSFTSGSFAADFKGISPGCFQMSTLSTESYILSGHCNTTCFWVIPPENNNGSVLLLDLQFLSLLKDDKISILELNSERTLIGVVNASMTHVPQVSLPSNVGAVVEINRGICEEKDNNIILIGHSSYVPACDKIMTLNASETFVVTSPLYPDTYPLHASCRWNVSVSKDNLVHLAFQKLKLAPNHCVKVVQTVDNKTFEGNSLPDDLFLYGELSIQFNSFNCKKSQVDATLVSDEGFVINGTVADCGSVLDGKTSGEFDTNLSGNKSQCIWKVSVPSNPDDMNIISYTISKTDNKENYDLHVYDGASIREMQITNDTGAELLSRTNNLIFVYKKLDVSKPSSVLKFKYSAKGCDKTMMCENKICMHPDWKCNGVNDCGDFSDEAHCKSKPLPPEIKFTGYSAMAFWMTLIAMFVIGVILGVVGPHLYQKYKNGQYRRFADISVIE